MAEVEVYRTELKTGIQPTREFERKRLASYSVNIGTKCGHGCHYCSSGALLRMHPSFSEIDRSPFENGFAIVDPMTPERVARDAKRVRRRGMVQLCTTVDAWAPEALEHDLGRRCLEAILAEEDWTVRVLTKNASVANDFDVIEQYRDRVLVGLSITATTDKTDIMRVVEPHASLITERLATLKLAHERELRTYGMLCPLLPGIAERPDQIDALIRLAVDCGVEEIFVEPVNPRGPGLRQTQEALSSAGYPTEALAIESIRNKKVWSVYVRRLVANVHASVRRHFDLDRTRILLYPTGLTPACEEQIREDDAAVIWLGKESPPTTLAESCANPD